MGGLGLVFGVVVEMVVVIFVISRALRELQWGRERELLLPLCTANGGYL